MKISVSILLLIIIGCKPAKQATRHINKAMAKDSATVAAFARKAFPCITTGADTLIVTNDSLIFIQCPAIDINEKIVDTIWTKIVQNKFVKVPVNVPVKTIYITKLIEDSAKIKVLQELSNIDKTKVGKLQHKVNFWFYWSIISTLLFLLAVIISLIKNKI